MTTQNLRAAQLAFDKAYYAQAIHEAEYSELPGQESGEDWWVTWRILADAARMARQELEALRGE